MNCSKCNSLNDHQAKFCNNCGSALAADQVQMQNVRVEDLESSSQTIGPKKRGGCLKSFIIVIGVLFVIFYLIGTFASDEEPTTTTNGNDIQTTKPTEEPFDLTQFKLEASTYPYKDLARNPNEYKDKKVGYRGRVIQVMESGNNVAYRIDITKKEYGYEDTIYVTYKRSKDELRILEDDIVTVWGLSKGLETYQSTMGGQITIPKISALAFELH
ncbi:hypothetical protein B1748_33175 [Paenibacillus sp. MY03]|uniref:zinc ribbon domain-containing protein n=1 Tax=Paenibacillus sp. MY03 TaxID=302980 RepID=UPI000B3C5059|nr:hypothetical protein [Paenibacillus sp. MY03]OUS68708.1 hypothetical protein B1748_33175 [Paenibacillus sp. MY03]